MPRQYDYNKYAAGNIRYPGGGGPNKGKTLDKSGYKKRDATTKSKMNALLRRMKAARTSRFMSADYLGSKNGSAGSK